MKTIRVDNMEFWANFRHLGVVYYLPDNGPGTSRSRAEGDDNSVYAKRTRVGKDGKPLSRREGLNPRGRFVKLDRRTIVEQLEMWCTKTHKWISVE